MLQHRVFYCRAFMWLAQGKQTPLLSALAPYRYAGRGVHQDQVVSFLLGNAVDTAGSSPARRHLFRPLFQKQSLSLFYGTAEV